jgi:hypothetical protein
VSGFVQPGLIGNEPAGARLGDRAICFQINEKLMFIGDIFAKRLEAMVGVELLSTSSSKLSRVAGDVWFRKEQ